MLNWKALVELPASPEVVESFLLNPFSSVELRRQGVRAEHRAEFEEGARWVTSRYSDGLLSYAKGGPRGLYALWFHLSERVTTLELAPYNYEGYPVNWVNSQAVEAFGKGMVWALNQLGKALGLLEMTEKPISILVVEDEAAQGHILKVALQKVGYRVTLRTGEPLHVALKAARLVRTQWFDLVVADSLDFHASLVLDEAQKKGIPFLLLTGRQAITIPEMFVGKVLPKPVPVNQLLVAVEEVLR